ncbi:MAG: GtrA family protein [Candidatus Moraniibacteriota bacterium]
MFKKLFLRFPILKQIVKFVIVGGINTGIDFLVLNIEMALTGITSGLGMLVLNTISFSVATTNSFFMNKRWTFEDKGASQEGVKFSQFLLVSIIGIIINTGVVYLITSFTTPLFGLSPQLWANVAKLLATGISLVWNFIGYKFFVFKR